MMELTWRPAAAARFCSVIRPSSIIPPSSVIPAKAGIHFCHNAWTPAFAGETNRRCHSPFLCHPPPSISV